MIKDKAYVKFEDGEFDVKNIKEIMPNTRMKFSVWHQGRLAKDHHIKYSGTITVLVISRLEFKIKGIVEAVDGDVEISENDFVDVSLGKAHAVYHNPSHTD